ncbi:RNA polymerase sigma factor [Lewinella sp. W8]|uniref:RNA polymerase sigma factor n=1 Tax=Lewinella sp. W8 TaxID=2528208 RepID=UPI001067DDB1|nr:sigma-70 family RNA polymerase sigma factor [Lewinella sp. W8]MTB52539.1 sigma-70 family RNA polymerase sigma factor [Lewinella sp. W8]
MSQLTDQHLPGILAGCRKQRRESQHALYKLYYAYGMSVAIRYVEEEPAAISVVNDAFLKVFKNVRRFDESRPFKPWFRTILVNTAINHIKQQHKYRKETAMENAKDIAAREEILSQISYQELIKLVQSLTTSYRTVFNMYVIDGFRHEEIARTLGISESTSKSNLVRARRKLQDLLQQQLDIKNA